MDADHGIGEGAGFGIDELELPGVDCDLHRTGGLRGARQLAAATELHDRPGPGGRGDCIEDVGAGERRDHRVGGTAQQLGRGGDLQEPALVDHGDTVGEGGRVLEGMRDQQRGELELAEQLGELVAHLPARDRIERAERLVEQQHAGLARERASERDTLSLAARELPGTRAGEVADPEALEQIGALALAGEAHVAGDGEVGEEAVVLRQVADAASLRAQADSPFRVEPGLAAEGDTSGGRPLESGDRPQ